MRPMQRYVCLAMLLAWLAGVRAAEAQSGGSSSPWYQGTSAEVRKTAEALYAQALDLHKQLLRDQALAKYEEALKHWEHPHVRWNLALLLTDMGQYLRAYENLEKALAWGSEAFDKDRWNKMKQLKQRLLGQHLAVLEVHSGEPKAEVAADGKRWFRGPGTRRKVVLPGEHVITANKPGYFPLVKAVTLPAGKQGTVVLAMDVDGIFEKRKWAWWKPWAVVGSGLALGLVGAGLQWQADNHFDQANREFQTGCNTGLQCDPSTPSIYGRAVTESRIAVGSLIAAGLTAATGLTLVYINRARAYRSQPTSTPILELSPILSEAAAGVSARIEF